jgi:hypothetical protein
MSKRRMSSRTFSVLVGLAVGVGMLAVLQLRCGRRGSCTTGPSPAGGDGKIPLLRVSFYRPRPGADTQEAPADVAGAFPVPGCDPDN